MSTVIVAMIVAVTAMAGPLLLAYITGRQRQREKAEDYERQDALANRAADAAEAARVAAEAVADRLKEDTATVAQSAAKVESKLDAIQATADATQATGEVTHKLVNSNLTAAKEGQLEALRDRLVWIREVMKLQTANGLEASPEMEQMVADAEDQILRLQQDVDDRATATAAAVQQQQQQQQQQQEQEQEEPAT